MAGTYGNQAASVITAPAQDGFAITPSDALTFQAQSLGPFARALYIGGAGNVVLKTMGGTQLTFVGLLAGSILPVGCTQVYFTNTTATNIIGLL